MEGLAELLALQEHDSAIDRLRHRRESLPELDELSDALKGLDETEAVLREAEKARDEVSGEMKRLEDELSGLTEKIEEQNKILYGGTIKANRELMALQADIGMLESQKSELEESVLEAMVRRDEAASLSSKVLESVTESSSKVAAIRGKVDALQRDIDLEISAEEEERKLAAAAVPDRDLLEKYDEMRASFGGVVISRLSEGVCGACRLRISSVALEELRATDGVPRCEHCSRILVP